jgi:hypothetical protein
MIRMNNLQALAILTAVSLAFGGCARNNSGDTKQAAAEIEQAFSKADAATKETVGAISEAMRQRDYDRAVMSLTAIQGQPVTTPEQLRAIQNSSIALQAELIRAMEAGDPKAKATYKLLQELRRN